ncbi:MAG: ribosome maturation factor RimM [Treponema sp.]|nr:ribosome maturation factor RimM [Treponema sp.]
MDKRSDGRLAIGRLGTPHGVRGDLKVLSYSGEFTHFLGLAEVDLEPASGEVSAAMGGAAALRRAAAAGGPAAIGDVTTAGGPAAIGGVTAAGGPGAAASHGAAASRRAPLRDASGRRNLHLRVRRVEEGLGGLVMAFAGYDSPEAARALTGMEIVVSRDKAAPLGPNEWYVTDLVGLELVSEGQALARVVSVLEGGSDPWLEAELPEGRRALVPFRKEFVGAVDIPAGRIELLAPWLLES